MALKDNEKDTPEDEQSERVADEIDEVEGEEPETGANEPETGTAAFEDVSDDTAEAGEASEPADDGAEDGDEAADAEATNEPEDTEESEEPKRKKSKSARKHEHNEAKKKAAHPDRKERSSASRKKPVKLHTGLPTPAWIAIAVVCLAVGLVLGHFVFGSEGVLGGSVAGKTTVEEGDLDDVMGSYTYNGKTYDVTIRDVIELSSTLDQAKNDDGTYNMPAADGVVSAARNQILLLEAKNQGIEATDDEVKAYAQEQLGSSDFDAIASQYGLDKSTVETMITQSATMDKLRKSVVTTDTGDMPEAPTEPESGQESTPTVDYFNYIINLAGDEWDSTNNTWKDTTGSYATALANYSISPDTGATYEAAQAAYYVAYQEYTTKATAASNEWVSYYNKLFANVTVQLNTAVSTAATTSSQS